MPAGRPREHDRDALLAAFLLYIAQTDIPIVAEFAVNQGFSRQHLYEFEELTDAIKLCISKKECALERKALAGEVNCTMAIFSLKQLGWKDAQKIEHTGPNDGALEMAVRMNAAIAGTDDPNVAANLYAELAKGAAKSE